MKKFFIILTLFFSIGCSPSPDVVAPIMNGYIIWKQGEAVKYYCVSQKVLYKSVVRACQDFNFPIEKEVERQGTIHLIAGNNNRFKITIEEIEPNISRLKIRIDFMGDRPYTELFYQKVDEQTGIIWFD